ncbi:MAG: hypothetical protein M0P59_08280 [Gallionella sp.]|jgi:hypothetical protein|nr:hypothetical protein [Gallionella sp.]MCK9354144.1 hypothetical protein [Gallionella sp.]
MIRSLQKWLSDPQQNAIAKYFWRLRKPGMPTQEVVLVQCVEDLYCLGIFGQIVSSLRERRSIRAEQYVLRSLRVGESRSLTGFAVSRLFINELHSFKWVRIYKSFCDGVAYRSVSMRPICDVIDACRAWQCWRGLTDKDSLLGLQMDGIVVGDLINDSFLRFKPAPTLDLKDIYLPVLLWQAYRDVRRANEYFSRARPSLYLTSYSTYIQHGIPVRAALRNGVRVFSFGNYQEFIKELTLQDWVHTKNPDGYAKAFFELDRQNEKLALAEQALSARLSGGVDGATAYMRKSAYAGSADPVPDVRGAVVIFLHDFYDSPHVYREMVFPDFWEWLCFSIETLTSANVPFFIKPHPNQIGLSVGVLDEIKRRYPGLSMIPVGITNRQLVDAGMSCAVTVYGTVAHEVAYLGVPSIACAHHPHISFGFCRTAQSRNEYEQLLRGSIRLSFDKEVMRRESLIFYYMHNLHLSEEMKVLRDDSMAFRMNCENAGEECDLVGALKQIAMLPGYRQSVARMIEAYAV